MLDLSDVGPAAQLAASGVTSIPGPLASTRAAFAAAAAVIETVHAGRRHAPLEILGDFVIPPVDGPPSRDFQTLHFDFGLPLSPALASDIACYTALHIPVDSPSSDARTRLVRLDALLSQRTWSDHDELLRRFAAYGETHGAWANSDGYIEGSLARIVESAGGGEPSLPSVKLNSGFLCGNEFSTLAAELDFFTAHGLSVRDVQIEVALEPGGVTIFDNLVLAHGRRGVRQPGELRQRVFGLRAVAPIGQCEVRDRVLAAFITRRRQPSAATANPASWPSARPNFTQMPEDPSGSRPGELCGLATHRRRSLPGLSRVPTAEEKQMKSS